MSRIITIISPQGDERVELHSNATTWGELKQEINQEGTFNADNSTAMIRGLRTNLESNTAALPEEPFSVFLTPSKIKSGL
jgi:hypothetical protein